MSKMFQDCSAFNAPLSSFSFVGIDAAANLSLFKTGPANAYPAAEYDALLVKWQADRIAAGSKLPANITTIVNAQYTKAPSAAATARAALVTAGWTITDGGPTP